MFISFAPLSDYHLPLLRNWLNANHIGEWLPDYKHIANKNNTALRSKKEKVDLYKWTEALIEKKYQDYVKGYKRINYVKRPIKAFIVLLDGKPKGYIQFYNFYDFIEPTVNKLPTLPKSLAEFQMFISSEPLIRDNMKTKVLLLFLEKYVFPNFDYVFIDLNTENSSAIKCYQKAGFKPCDKLHNKSKKCMIKARDVITIIENLERSLLKRCEANLFYDFNNLLADNFKEFGASGKIYSKQDIIASLSFRLNEKIIAKDFDTKELAPGIFLVTYRAFDVSRETLRSSIWKKFDADYKMIFHQGTIVNK